MTSRSTQLKSRSSSDHSKVHQCSDLLTNLIPRSTSRRRVFSINIESSSSKRYLSHLMTCWRLSYPSNQHSRGECGASVSFRARRVINSIANVNREHTSTLTLGREGDVQWNLKIAYHLDHSSQEHPASQLPRPFQRITCLSPVLCRNEHIHSHTLSLDQFRVRECNAIVRV